MNPVIHLSNKYIKKKNELLSLKVVYFPVFFSSIGFAMLDYCHCLFLNDKTLSGKVTQNRVKYVPIMRSNAYLTACVVEPNEGERNHLEMVARVSFVGTVTS